MDRAGTNHAIVSSSERNNRGTKFKDYATLASLREYVLIESEGPDQWSLPFYSGFERTAKLSSLEIEFSLADLFASIRFDAPQV
ncbi:hypothetical protein BH11ARM2_BH11ARM2_19700 [soil metagenome]